MRWIRQIIMLCHGSYTRGERENFFILRPFLENVFAIATPFGIESDEVLNSQELGHWMNTWTEESENSYNEPGINSGSSDETKLTDTTEDNTSKAVAVMETSGKTLKLFQDMVNLRDSCNEAAQALTSLNPSKTSEEAFASWRQRYVTLLRRLESLEENGQDLSTVVASHLEIYNLLLIMAPKFQHLNPRLGDLVRGRMQQIQLNLPVRK